MQDAIVEEIRRVREEHAAKFNYDIDAIFADLKRLESERGLAHVHLNPRLIVKTLSDQPSLLTEIADELAIHQVVD